MFEGQVYRFTRVIYGSHNGPVCLMATLQRLKCRPSRGARIYVDDILIAGRDTVEQIMCLDKVLGQFEAVGMTINLRKGRFVTTQIIFLVFSVTLSGTSKNLDYVRMIKSISAPKSNMKHVFRISGTKFFEPSF